MTQRLFETVLTGCLPLAPVSIRDSGRFAPTQLHVAHGDEAAARIDELSGMIGGQEHVELLHVCITRLELFRLSR